MLHISKLLYETRMSYQVSFLCSLQPQQKYILSPANYILVADYPPSPPMSEQPTLRPGPSQYRSFTVTFRNTTLGRTPPDEWSVRRTELWQHTHTHTRQTDIHAVSVIRTRNLNKRAIANPRLRPRGHRDRLVSEHCFLNLFLIPSSSLVFTLLVKGTDVQYSTTDTR